MWAKALLLVAAAAGLLEVVRPPGLDFTHRNSPTSQKYLIETMGGGVALFDYNQDGRLDVFLVNSGRLEDPVNLPARFARNNPAYWNRLYRQNAGGSFTDVTEAAGISHAGDGNYGMGAAVGDYNNDGFPDLYITNYGRNQLYRNNGNGTFTDVTEEAGVGAGGWSVSAGSTTTTTAVSICSSPAISTGALTAIFSAVSRSTPIAGQTSSTV